MQLFLLRTSSELSLEFHGTEVRLRTQDFSKCWMFKLGYSRMSMSSDMTFSLGWNAGSAVFKRPVLGFFCRLLLPLVAEIRYKMTAHRCFLWFSVKVIYHAPFKKRFNQIHQSILEKIVKTVAGVTGEVSIFRRADIKVFSISDLKNRENHKKPWWACSPWLELAFSGNLKFRNNSFGMLLLLTQLNVSKHKNHTKPN